MKVCPYCMATKGLKGSDITKNKCDYVFEDKDIEGFANHLEEEHNIPVRRKGETKEECKKRFYNKYPEAINPENCKCPSCKAKRGDFREKLVSAIRGV